MTVALLLDEYRGKCVGFFVLSLVAMTMQVVGLKTDLCPNFIGCLNAPWGRIALIKVYLLGNFT